MLVKLTPGWQTDVCLSKCVSQPVCLYVCRRTTTECQMHTHTHTHTHIKRERERDKNYSHFRVSFASPLKPIFSFFLFLSYIISLSLSLSHTHTHTHILSLFLLHYLCCFKSGTLEWEKTHWHSFVVAWANLFE